MATFIFTPALIMKNITALLFVVCVATPALGQQSDSFAMKKRSCPPVGKDKAGKALGKTTDGGLRNMAKRHLPAGSEPARLSVADFVGGLTYDNEHLVNADAKQKKPGQPARMSLWEIHPITEFLVCESGTCDPAKHSEWMTLTTWAKNNPQ